MMRVNNKRFPVRLFFLGIATVLLMGTVALAIERGPKELRGKVTAVVGDRIHISLSQQKWLPRAGVAVNLGEEMAGMFVPLKGSFVIIQVNADSCIAKAVGNEEHGKPAAGMAAVMKTPYPPFHPQSRADYISSLNGPDVKKFLKIANGGSEMAQLFQNGLARTYTDRGDHDKAFKWWERSSKDSNEPMLIDHSATNRANILGIRGEFKKALSILRDASSRLALPANKMVFAEYSLGTGAASAYVNVLKELGFFYHRYLNNIEESNRWYRAATKVMAACATKGVPKPKHAKYQHRALLTDLVFIHRHILKDDAAAVPWLKILARTGDKNARKTLTEMGRTW
ncbi:MAG: sel1 repeat family protein [Candidatus Aminicenantes bacterium]|nr:sel1 repeat family protein [Candidatus Aminicenantes bacterium]